MNQTRDIQTKPERYKPDNINQTKDQIREILTKPDRYKPSQRNRYIHQIERCKLHQTDIKKIIEV